jgi:hypothetical protein
MTTAISFATMKLNRFIPALAGLLVAVAGCFSSAEALTNKKIAIIMVNFQNNTSQPYSPDYMRSAVFTGPESSNKFYQEQSFSKVGLAGKVRPDGDVFGWYTIGYNDTTCDDQSWANAARTAAQNDGHDLSGYDTVIYMWTRTEACNRYSGINKGNKTIYLNPRLGSSERSMSALVSHELGHDYFYHAGSYNCTEGGVRVPISTTGNCTWVDRGDVFTIMGKGYYHFNAREKESAGYFSAGNMRTWSSDGDYTIAPLETSSTGVQLIKIPRPSAGNNNYYLEFRQPFGFDNFAANNPVVQGITIRTNVALLDMTPETTTFNDASLGVGKTFYDRFDNFYIQVLSVSPSGANVRIKRGRPPSDTTPPAISSVAAGNVNSSGATITWTTNEASDSQVEYGLTTSYGSVTALNTAMVTSHSTALSGLQAGKTYNYRVKSKDAAGNLAVSANFTFTTSGGTADTTAPTISSVAAGSITSNSATITWTTNEASDSQVQYGTSTAYGSATPVNTSLVTSHSVGVSGLQAGRTYHYRVKSRDAAGNLAASADFTFTTPSGTSDTTAPTISSVQAADVTASGARITWTTNEASDSRVQYGTSTAYGSWTPLDANLVTSHSVALSGLQAGKTYHFKVHSKDAAGNAAGATGSFTTPSGSVSPPAAPSSLTAWPDTALGGIRLNWTDNSSNEEGFKIERKPYGGVYAQIATVGANVRAYHDTAATNMYTVYFYRVRAYNAGGHSAYSNEAYTRAYRMGQAALAGQSAEKFLSPGLADGRNDKAVFGPEAEEVVIVDANGSLVFQGASDGTGPIVWDGKGRDGHVVPSGAYIAQIRQEDGQVVYQTLAIVK